MTLNLLNMLRYIPVFIILVLIRYMFTLPAHPVRRYYRNRVKCLSRPVGQMIVLGWNHKLFHWGLSTQIQNRKSQISLPSALCFSQIRNPKSKILSAPCSALRVFLDHSPDFRINFIRFHLRWNFSK